MLATDKVKRDVLSIAEAKKLFSIDTLQSAWKGNVKLFAANLLAASTGMREGELRGLQIKNVHDAYIDVLNSWEQGHGLKGAKWGYERRETPQFESLLIDAWSSIAGSEETKLAARKLMRLEGLEKREGKLYFDIERHGGTVHGLTRGEVYTWEVEVEHATATIIKKTHRQLYKADKRLDVGPMAQELADCIIGKQPHPHLKWNENKSSCKLLIGNAIPKAYKQTTAGRRDRLRHALNALLLPQGLEITKRNVVQVPENLSGYVVNRRVEAE